MVLGVRDPEAGERVAAVIHSNGGTATPVTLDVRDAASVERFCAEARAAAGPPSVLINNAGTATFRNADNLQLGEVQRMLETNLLGPWLLSKHALPHLLLAECPRIVHVSSLAGRYPFRMGSIYCATKAGLEAFADCQMLELRERGIGVMIVCPGSMDTAFHQESHIGMHPKDQTWMLGPEEVARLISDALRMPAHALPSRLEVRPLQPAPPQASPSVQGSG